MHRFRSRLLLVVVPLLAIVATGCSQNTGGSIGHTHAVSTSTTDTAKPTEADAAIQAERAKLSPEDRALVEAQEWCVTQTEERLGSMGPPIKLMIKDQPVFICCKGCRRKAEADPDKTLAMVEQLKANKKAAKTPK